MQRLERASLVGSVYGKLKRAEKALSLFIAGMVIYELPSTRSWRRLEKPPSKKAEKSK